LILICFSGNGSTWILMPRNLDENKKKTHLNNKNPATSGVLFLLFTPQKNALNTF
jgi:hypothetical protein